jgi:hypothetical protein
VMERDAIKMRRRHGPSCMYSICARQSVRSKSPASSNRRADIGVL